MTVDDLRRALHDNNVREDCCLIFPRTWVMGPLCLSNRQPFAEDNRWRVFSFDQGGYNIDRTFDSENDACRFFLKEALSDPICRKDFKAFPPTPEEFDAWRKKELDKYGLNDVDDPPIPA